MQNAFYTLDEIINLVKPLNVKGHLTHATLMGVASLDKALPTDLSFLGNSKYRLQVGQSKAGVILVPPSYLGEPHKEQVFLTVNDPSEALNIICRDLMLKNTPKINPGIHPTAVVDPTAKVDPTAAIGPLCVVGAHSVIGAHVVLSAHVFVGDYVQIQSGAIIRPNCSLLDGTQIGKRCFIDAGVVLGSEGYGYTTVNGAHQRCPQIGCVVLEDDVDIGANTTIDRARFEETRIGEGTKIDNLVQIGHNVVIGKHCFIVAFAGIAGSTHVGDYTTIAGQAGLAGHINIGSHVVVGAQSGVNHDLPDHSFVRGTPVFPFMLAHRIDNLKRRLPDLFKRVDNLEKVFAYLTDNAAKSCFLKQVDAKHEPESATQV